MEDDARIEEELRARLHTLERSATLGYLLSAVVHEINNPLSVLLIGADQLRHAGAGEAAEQGVDSLVRQAERIVGIARQLQDLVRANLAERQAVDAAELLSRFVRLERWAEPERPPPVLELREASLPVEIHPDLFVQVCRYLTSSVRALWSEGDVRVVASIEDVHLIALPGLAERSPKRTYAVLRFVRGAPSGEMVSLKETLQDFFSRPRPRHEVELMAAWEIVRKANGKLNISRDPASGVEAQVLLPLRAGAR